MSHLCGTRLCHEIAHAWFGLAIGARDWTEEWLSEGFATHLEDVFWAEAQQVGPEDFPTLNQVLPLVTPSLHSHTLCALGTMFAGQRL